MLPRPAITSHSLGRAWVHNLPEKLDAAARYGLDIELFYEDLQYVAKELPGGATPENNLAAAHIVRSWCDQRGITIINLQPFMHYEGLRDRQKHACRIEEMKLFIQMAHILGTDTIAIPSSFLRMQETSADIDLITADLQEVADLGALEGIQFAYESLAWGTHTNTWEQAWDIVKRVDRSNFGICLDTFNMAARVYADPASPTQRNPNAAFDMAASIRRLVAEIDVRKIVCVQVVDGQRLEEPLVPGHKWYDAAQPARMSWSRNCRLFYGEYDRGAYLPVREILHAIVVDLGFRGRFSAELFNISLVDADPSVPREHARRAAESWQKILRDLGMRGPRRHTMLAAPEQAARL